jgi:nucleotidyltransferase substrate binding protein (TIGR01987 family)
MCVNTKIDVMGKALDCLEEALSKSTKDLLALDASIHRFEFSVELSWEALKHCLLQEGIKTTTPRDCLKHAFVYNWIKDDVSWLRMLQDHTLASSSYDTYIASQIYNRLLTHYKSMKQLHLFLTNRFLCF